jgi:hypothetical protein
MTAPAGRTQSELSRLRPASSLDCRSRSRTSPSARIAQTVARRSAGDIRERYRGLRLRFVYRRRGPSLLVAEGRLNTRGRAVASRSKTGRGLTTVPIFLLVRQVKLPKRLDLARDAQRTHDAAPGLIVANWVDRRLG